jgi:hypothetical protein
LLKYDPAARPSALSPATYIGLVGAFLAVEVIYHACGIHFDAAPLNSSWQFLDPLLLRTDLLRSVWYLHSQPPVFNLCLGIVVKLTGSHWESAFHLLYVGCGLTLYIGLVMLMQRLGVRLRLAVLAATLFLVSPSFMLYEHWLFYTFPVAMLLVMAVLALARLLNRPSPVRGLVFCSVVFLLCGIQNMYQFPYFVLSVVGIAALHPRGRRAVLCGAVLPFALLCTLYVKNTVVFGVPSTGSWAGMSLAKMTIDYLPTNTLHTLVTSGMISPLSLVEPFSPPDAYPPAYFTATGFDKVPAVSARLKSTGAPNMNHVGFVGVSRQYLRDSLAVLWRYPRTLAAASGDAWWIYSWSSSEYRFLERNRAQVAGWNRAFDRILYGHWRDSRVYLGLVIGLSLAVVFATAVLFSGERAYAGDWRILACVLFNILYVAVVGNMVEMGENNRFRFTTDALSVAILALMGQWVYDGRRSRRAQCSLAKMGAAGEASLR